MSKIDDTERLEKDVLHCFAKVAQRRLDGEKHADFLSDYEIKHNGTSRKKTVRLLRQHGYMGTFVTTTDRSYGYSSKTKRWEILKFDSESEALTSKGSFKTSWQDLYEELFGQHYYDKSSIQTVGYISNEGLSDTARLDVFWHPDDYDRHTDERGHISFYPKAFLRQRNISALRAFVEHRFNEGFSGELEKRAGMPNDSLYAEKEIITTIRNFAYTPFHFNDDSFHGSKGFLAELDHQITYFKALRNRVQRFADLATKTGGFDELIRQYRKALIDELFEEAPLRAFQEVDEDKDGDIQGEQGVMILGAQFILKHSDLFDYDTLYASGEDVAFIRNGRVRDESPYLEFTPDAQQVSLITADGSTEEPVKTPSSGDRRKERNACLAKMITETLLNTSK